MDISKFFESIDRDVMKRLLLKHIKSDKINSVLFRVMDMNPNPVGMPLGNITSQLYANILLNEVDQYIKHKLRVKYYVRYADDMMFIIDGKENAKEIKNKVGEFLKNELKLTLNPHKVYITTANRLNALGSIVYENTIALGNRAKRNFIKHLKKGNPNSLNSWLGCVGLAKCYSFIYRCLNSPDNKYGIVFEKGVFKSRLEAEFDSLLCESFV